VVDIPAEHIPALDGLTQQRARGSLAGADFASNVMPAGGGRLALGVSEAAVSDGRAGSTAIGRMRRWHDQHCQGVDDSDLLALTARLSRNRHPLVI
jgi:hypothetical protein